MMERKPKADDRKRVYDNRLVCVITQDSERILIGSPNNIRERLQGREAPVDADITRPFGSYLVTFNFDKESWNNAIDYLKKAQDCLHTFNIKKGKKVFVDGTKWAPDYEKEAWNILITKYNSGDPICQYVSKRIWYGYWLFREKKDPELCANYLKIMANMVRPFGWRRWALHTGLPIDTSDPIFLRIQETETCDSEQLIFSVSVPNYQEYIVISDSMLPLEKYYMTKCVARKNYVIECKVCKKAFIAKTLRYELCSGECREQARLKNLATRKETGNTAEVDRICINASAYWNNRLTKMRKSGLYSEEQLEPFISAKNRFQKEKNKKRQEHKKGKISFEELQNWLLCQEREAQVTMEQVLAAKQ